MKTITISAYHPWGASHYRIELIYRHDVIKTFESHDYDTLVATAKAWAIINGYTHWANSGTRGKL
jgi:hypothetical protein